LHHEVVYVRGVDIQSSQMIRHCKSNSPFLCFNIS
jgi:hypothetical protein